MRNYTLKYVLVLAVVCYTIAANSLNERRGAMVMEILDKDTINVIAESDSLFAKGKFFYNEKEYTKAIGYFLKSDSVIDAHYGTGCPYYGYGKKWTACCYHKLGMDSIASEYSIYYDKQPIDKLLTHSSDSIVWIGLKMIDLGQIKNAAEKLLEAATLEKQELGANSYWYANTISNCAGLYSEIGSYDKAIELGKEAVEIYKLTFGTNHPNYASCLNNLATCYADAGNYSAAIQYSKEALEIRKRLSSSEDPDNAIYLNNLATYYADAGNYPAAIQYAKEALVIRKGLSSSEDPDYATELSNLAEYYSSIGNYTEALRLGTEARNIRKRIFGTEHSDYAISLICLANYYSNVGNYTEALRLGIEAMEIWKKILGPNNPYYATSLHYLATYYSNLGNYTKALQLATEAMKIRKDVFGVEHPQYATSLGNVAVYNSYLGNFTEALHIGKEVLEIDEKVFGIEHPQYAISLACLASYYSDLGNYAEAKRLCNKALDIWQKNFGSEHPDFAKLLNSLAYYNASSGNYFEALIIGKKAMEIRKKIIGTEHPDYALSLFHLASYYSHLGSYAEAYNCMKQQICSSQPFILNKFVELSTNLRKSFWTNKFALNYIKVFPNIVEKYKNKESISELYDKTCLFAKGILLNTDMGMRNFILESGDSTLITKYNDLTSNLIIFNKLIEKPINKRFMNADSLNRVIEQQEMELARESKAFGDYTHNLTISWKDVQEKLGDNDIAIEFLDFPIYNSDSTMYVALTLKKGYECPHMVTLFEENQLKAISEDVYYTQTDVSKLVWKPLEEELRDVRNVYFAPSGELHRIGIEYLPISKTENICEVYFLHRLSSTRQLAVIQDETEGKNTILYGGINYDKKSNTISTDSVSVESSISRSAFSRANVDSLSLRSSFEYLEGTKRETDMIAEDMEQHHLPYIYYTGIDGTEESFKLLDGKMPKAMHIATHGFYFAETKAEKSQFARPEMELMTDGIQKKERFKEDKPMTRSGLLFSGCNRAFRHEQIPEGEEDGILTAQEISTLDLRGLDLVVLSACQTGLGDVISGEGVFGLQRGFKKAGAKTILMSLNKVDDEATRILMVEFYRNLMNGKTKRQSLQESQQYLRKVDNGKYDDPKYWASFIMLDGLN